MADEVLGCPIDAMRVAANRSADVFAVKIGQSGGLRRASEVIAIGQAAGPCLYGGTTLEAGMSTAAALQLFATVEALHWGTELFEPLLLKDEIPAEPIRDADSCVHLPHGPGIGVTLDPDSVRFHRPEHGATLAPTAS